MVSAVGHSQASHSPKNPSSALLEQCLARIARHNPAINALVTLDEARARRAAVAVDALLVQGVAWFDAQPLLGPWQASPDPDQLR